jgi:hypothetical protein
VYGYVHVATRRRRPTIPSHPRRQRSTLYATERAVLSRVCLLFSKISNLQRLRLLGIILTSGIRYRLRSSKVVPSATRTYKARSYLLSTSLQFFSWWIRTLPGVCFTVQPFSQVSSPESLQSKSLLIASRNALYISGSLQESSPSSTCTVRRSLVGHLHSFVSLFTHVTPFESMFSNP